MRIIYPRYESSRKKGVLEKKVAGGFSRSMKDSSNILKYAKQMRDNPTECEALLLAKLLSSFPGYKLKVQAIIGARYIVDFYFSQCKLVIEADGWHHNEGTQHTRDLYRDKYLNKNGYRVLRISNSDIRYRMDAVIDSISKLMILR